MKNVFDFSQKKHAQNGFENVGNHFLLRIVDHVDKGIDQFKIVMDSSNNTAEDIEQNRLNGRIVLVPTRAIEFVAIDFIITNSGVSFE